MKKREKKEKEEGERPCQELFEKIGEESVGFCRREGLEGSGQAPKADKKGAERQRSRARERKGGGASGAYFEQSAQERQDRGGSADAFREGAES